MLPIQRNDSSNTQSATQKNPARCKPQIEQSGWNFIQRNTQIEQPGWNFVLRNPQMAGNLT